jgi:Glycosyl hydrolase family 65, N-terminal domain
MLGTMNTFAALGSLTLSLLFSKACRASQLSSDESLLRKSFSLPTSGSALWYRTPAANWAFESLPLGNGYLGGESSMQFHD